MNEALNYLWYIGENFIEWILESAQIIDGVTIGYILIATIIMGMLIGTLTSLPNNLHFNIQKQRDAAAAKERKWTK